MKTRPRSVLVGGSLFGGALVLSGLVAFGAFQLLARTFTRLVRDPAKARVAGAKRLLR